MTNQTSTPSRSASPSLSTARGTSGPDSLTAIQQAVRLLCARITDGTYPPLATIPPAHALAVSPGVSTAALRHAVLYLSLAGVLSGRGSTAIVCRDAPARLAAPITGRALTTMWRRNTQSPGLSSAQLADRIRADVKHNRWPREGTYTLKGLAIVHQVPQTTLNQAVKALREEGVLDVRTRVGVRLGSGRPGRAQRRQDMTLTQSSYTLIRDRIKEGAYPPGSRLPSSNQLGQELQVSKNTVAAALNRLRHERWLDPGRRVMPFDAARPCGSPNTEVAS
ncbi:GntR family transcriptional regulator [Streptomyces sp. TLI_146]|uniref:GntR family transcriptional regulator n=1 Tax=Streptomyces sp. TLI_146 TaxID=1938858 RepID=UPI00214C0CE9|nr:GntR family transcriptional regulator [Streptomyces sp. TLI_146]